MTAAERRQWLILLGLCLGICVTNSFARFAYGLVLPAMKAELGWSYTQAGWLNTANALGYLAGAVLTMVLIRRVSPARLFSFGFVTTTVALLATGLDAGLGWQSLWRFLAGIFGALSFSSAGALAARLFPEDPRRNALAIALLFGFGGGLGIVLAGGPLPVMLDRFGPGAWPYGWFVVGGLSLVFLAPGLWAGRALRPPRNSPPPRVALPMARMLPLMAAYGAFGLGYFVYFTFLSAWMTEAGAGGGFIALVWVLLGVCLCLSPFVWRPVLARHAGGRAMAMILACIALGSALPVLLPGALAPPLSALIFGLSVFMAPGAVTSFCRQNLPAEAWGAAIAVFTVVFAASQTLGPVAAGWIGDRSGDIGHGMIAAALVLAAGAGLALVQKRL